MIRLLAVIVMFVGIGTTFLTLRSYMHLREISRQSTPTSLQRLDLRILTIGITHSSDAAEYVRKLQYRIYATIGFGVAMMALACLVEIGP